LLYSLKGDLLDTFFTSPVVLYPFCCCLDDQKYDLIEMIWDRFNYKLDYKKIMPSEVYKMVQKAKNKYGPNENYTAIESFKKIINEIFEIAKYFPDKESEIIKIIKRNENLFLKQRANYQNNNSSTSIKEEKDYFKVNKKREVVAYKNQQIIYAGKYELMGQQEKDLMEGIKVKEKRIREEEKKFIKEFNKRNRKLFKTTQEKQNDAMNALKQYRLMNLFKVQHEGEQEPIKSKYSNELFVKWMESHQIKELEINQLTLEKQIPRVKLKEMILRYHVHAIKSKFKLDLGMKAEKDVNLNYIYNLFNEIELGDLNENSVRMNNEESRLTMVLEEGITLEKICIKSNKQLAGKKMKKEVEMRLKEEKPEFKAWKTHKWSFK
jgi:hypothetical protein